MGSSQSVVVKTEFDIIKLDTATGEVIWKQTPADPWNDYAKFKAGPAIDRDDNIYICKKPSSKGGSCYRFDGAGNIVWQNDLGFEILTTPVLGDNGVLYVASERDDRQRS